MTRLSAVFDIDTDEAAAVSALQELAPTRAVA